MSAFNYYDPDPDEFFHQNTPLMTPRRPEVKPSPNLKPDFEDDSIESFDLNTPWAPALRVSGFPVSLGARPNHSLLKQRKTRATDPSALDAVLLEIMSGRDPAISRQAQLEALLPPSVNSRCLPTDSLLDGTSVGPSRSDQTMPKGHATKTLKRWGLPIYIKGEIEFTKVITCADSGSDDNVMSWKFAQSLGLALTSFEYHQKDFCLANGKLIRSLGKVVSLCNFASGMTLQPPPLIAFYVFQTLAVDVIMGMAFLEATETFTSHRDRLVEIAVPQTQALRVHSIGAPRRHLLCRLDDHVVFANADSGSDIDLMSLSYARTRFNIRRTKRPLWSTQPSETISKEFHVFEKLVHEVLIGHETIETLHVFTDYSSSLLSGIDLTTFSSLNIIRHLRKLNFPGLKKVTEPLRRLVQPEKSNTSSSHLPEDHDEDQGENARHSAELERIEALDDEVEAAKLRQEEHQRHNGYLASQIPYSATSSFPPLDVISLNAPITGHFICTFPDCNAQPFPTQYLLNSYANVHSSARPH
ncbi:hypothetical protein HD806DRAFT_533728 [Xylariaceae sp. AK1471]|nr:hypothetical protein HD806DRAFT_533728 [Xylariaceae sp. AK1471]